MVLLNNNEELNESDSDGEESSSISLSDFPIMTATAHSDQRSDGQGSPSDFFGFFTATSEMCAADDVILRGKLLPFRAPPPPRAERSETRISNSPEFDHRRSNSLDDDPRRGFWGGKITGEYRKLKRVSDSDLKGAPDPRKPRPRWYVLVFGSMKVPAAMEMKEIRIRQRRRSAPPLGRKEAAGDSGERGPWKLLRSLSCKGMEAAVVA